MSYLDITISYISSPNISYPYGGFLKWGYPQIIHFCFCFSAFPLKPIHFGVPQYFPLCLYVPIVYHIFPDFPPIRVPICSNIFDIFPYVFPYVPIVSRSIPPYPTINQWNIQPVRRSASASGSITAAAFSAFGSWGKMGKGGMGSQNCNFCWEKIGKSVAFHGGYNMI